MSKPVVGLFGTCGDSKWRDKVIPLLQAAGIEFYNPVVENWTEECMKIEADHAANDQVIMFVITGETTAIASMAESGWLALQAKLRGQNFIAVLEDMNPEPSEALLRINKTRKLLRNHIAALPEEAHDSISICATIEEATQKAISILKK